MPHKYQETGNITIPSGRSSGKDWMFVSPSKEEDRRQRYREANKEESSGRRNRTEAADDDVVHASFSSGDEHLFLSNDLRQDIRTRCNRTHQIRIKA